MVVFCLFFDLLELGGVGLGSKFRPTEFSFCVVGKNRGVPVQIRGDKFLNFCFLGRFLGLGKFGFFWIFLPPAGGGPR